MEVLGRALCYAVYFSHFEFLIPIRLAQDLPLRPLL